MSRIGKLPVEIPSGVNVRLDGQALHVKGPKGELNLAIHPDIRVEMEGQELQVKRPSDERNHRALHGLTRALVANMVHGVHTGFQKTLEIVGVGYRAEKRGQDLVLNLGYSHQIHYPAPDGITLEAPNPTTVTVSGADKAVVGQVAAEIRGFRPPEPYKGKGVRYQGEQVRRKAGKAAGK
jgi:large subunit ribosomal protein L6